MTKPNYVATITAATHPHLFTGGGLEYCHELDLRHPFAEMTVLRSLEGASRSTSRALLVEMGKGSLAVRYWTELTPGVSLTVFDHQSHAARKRFRYSIGETMAWEGNLEKCTDMKGSADICCDVNSGVGNVTNLPYLQELYNLLKPEGTLILSQEFLPDYRNQEEWTLRTVAYYAAIITQAIDSERWTLTDCSVEALLQALIGKKYLDKDALVDCVYKYARTIHAATLSKPARVGHIIHSFLAELSQIQPLRAARRPVKLESPCVLSANEFERQADTIGFKVREKDSYDWHLGTIAELVVYTLDKQN
ncbi:MAG: hypothetical protein HY817_03810 [Candidatus Abawacabacteria bacterium]|nr:hypothetical protein [Candidatus Abawacabacteria bacterium]